MAAEGRRQRRYRRSAGRPIVVDDVVIPGGRGDDPRTTSACRGSGATRQGTERRKRATWRVSDRRVDTADRPTRRVYLRCRTTFEVFPRRRVRTTPATPSRRGSGGDARRRSRRRSPRPCPDGGPRDHDVAATLRSSTSSPDMTTSLRTVGRRRPSSTVVRVFRRRARGSHRTRNDAHGRRGVYQIVVSTPPIATRRVKLALSNDVRGVSAASRADDASDAMKTSPAAVIEERRIHRKRTVSAHWGRPYGGGT